MAPSVLVSADGTLAHAEPVEGTSNMANGAPGYSNGGASHANGLSNGLPSGMTNGHSHEQPNGVHPTRQTNGINGRANGHDHLDASPPSQGQVPIAIVGMGMRLPGGISNSAAFWDLLINKREGRIPVPGSRWNSDGFYDPSRRPGTVTYKEGSFLDLDPAAFDAEFWSLPPGQVEESDPQQRILLETAYEAIENAGETNVRGRRVGVYTGTFAEDWLEMQARDSEPRTFFKTTGSFDLMNSNLLSYEFDWHGPSMTFKTGCSASLVALDSACSALTRGECDSAIVGGTNLILSPGLSCVLGAYGVTSTDGRSRSFDAKASGYGRAEAVSSLYIKRLDDALRDGNPIRAVIRTTSCNDDGKTPGITAPNTHAHEALIRSAYRSAGLCDRLHETAYFECHGTGTPVGDPIEAGAVARVFGESGMIIGSVKSNIGHSESASGNSSVIKGILALENLIIPPNANFETPNPKIPWEEAKLTVATEPLPWPADRKERLSVNSFGIGGSNAHVILESARHHGVEAPKAPSVDDAPRVGLLLFSARTEQSLQAAVANHEQYLQKHGPTRLRDLAYTLANRRDHHELRTFAITDGDDLPLVAQPAVQSKGGDRPLVFVFTGQGAQWAEMGKQLIDDFPSVAENIDSLDDILARCHTPPTWKIYNEIRKPKLKSQISKAEFSQPLCTALQIILVDLLRSWGIAPAAVAGHSSGEIAAAYCTGSLSKKEAILAAYFRGLATREKKRDGSMAAIGMGAERVRPFLTEGVVIGCENSPSSVTVSGDREAVDGLIASLRREHPDVFARPLQVDNAYHSHHMKAFGEAYEASVKDVTSEGAPSIPLFSSVTGKRYESAGVFDASYWRSNLESPVLFHTAIRNLLGASFENPVLVEVGPHSALAGPLRQILQDENAPYTYVPSLQRGKDDTESLYACVGSLWAQGVKVDFGAVNPVGNVLTDLPTYAWDHSRSYLKESRMCREWRTRSFLPHETLGVRLAGTSHLEPSWRNVLTLDKAGWIRDHVVSGSVVFPASGYVGLAGEAIRQVTGQPDYTIRGMAIKTAMIFVESKDNDVITTLRKAKLTDKDESDWWEFRVTSFNGSAWTEHCSGQVKPGPVLSKHDAVAQPDQLRRVSPGRWYTTLSKIGFSYGPSFRGLEDITADPVGSAATATIRNVEAGHSSYYELHPSIIDMMLQLMIVTQHQGDPTLLKQLRMPTHVEEIYVSAAGRELRATADSHIGLMDRWLGNAVATSGGRTVFRLRGLSVSAMGSSVEEASVKTAIELAWKPDLDFLDPGSLIRTQLDYRDYLLAVEKYCFLLALETAPLIANVATRHEHLVKFRAWVDAFVEHAASGNHRLLPDGKELYGMSAEERSSLAARIGEELGSSVVACIQTALQRVHQSAKAVFEGMTDTLDVLMEGGILTQIYGLFDTNWDYSELLGAMGHKKPTLRVLEIGAGTGGTTQILLQGLRSHKGDRLYSRYSYTDVSAGFFVAAKERFKDFDNIDFQVLDITRDPVEQGFVEGSYDLILAANVIHATPSLRRSLQNVRKLLHPGGRLVLQELDMQAWWIGFVMGGFSGWWLGEEDGRPDRPYVSPERWDAELRAAGFSGTDVVQFCNERPYHVNATYISRPVQESIVKKPVVLLHLGEATPEVLSFRGAFEDAGHATALCRFDEEVPQGTDVVALLDFAGPFFAGITQADFERIQKLVTTLGTTKLLWLTRQCSMDVQDPRYGQVLGFLRTLRSERHSEASTLEIDDVADARAPGLVVKVFEQMFRQHSDPELDPDYEYALKDGTIYSSRYYWFDVEEELSKPDQEIDDKVLMIGQRGMVDSLRWEDNHLIKRKLEEGELMVKPHTVGVNFKDILQAQGVIDGNDLGIECSGTVLEVGPGVTEFRPGDRVFTSTSYCFASRVITHRDTTAKIPDKMSMEDAATMPTVYTTVLYGLLHLRRLKRGETILIHSACGGIGLCAIQVAAMVGARVLATVGSEDKVRYLVDNHQIPREHIFDSHGNSFVPDVMAATGGRGVDVCLNSLAGELLHATWQCIAPFGAMIEIGKRDFYGHASVDMYQFTKNRAFYGLDAKHIQEERPEICGEMLREAARYFEQGLMGPIPTHMNFSAAEVGEAFRHMQKGTHVGKFTVTMPEDSSELPAGVVQARPKLDAGASYFLPGGLGGIGRSVSSWLVKNGAKNLVFLSRSGRTEKNESFCRELEAQGCDVQIFKGSVVDLDDVKRAVAEAHRPIRGVVQLSMVLQDRAMDTMTHQDWLAAVRPKVDGTWNIHHATASSDLDFFVIFSSTGGILGQYGQANYSSANTFLDSFAQYRQSQGLAASVVDLGVMDDVGFVAESAQHLDYFRFLDSYLISETEMRDAVLLLARRSRGPGQVEVAPRTFANPSQFALGIRSHLAIDDPANRILWKRDRRFAAYRSVEAVRGAGQSTDESLQCFLTGLSRDTALSDESVEFLAVEVGKTLYGFMMKKTDKMDLDEPLAAMGLDSLVGIELRNWCKAQLGFEISILEAMQSTLRGIAKAALEDVVSRMV